MSSSGNKIEVHYFASFRELVGIEQEQIVLTETINSIADLIATLAERKGEWLQVFNGRQQILCAVNHELVKTTQKLKAGDEVAFFPPVSGG